jgi:phosphatidate cytidylyltransferase
MMDKNLIQRTISAVILAPLVLAIINQGGIVFVGLIILLTILMAFEWENITSRQQSNKGKWKLLGVLYILAPCLALIYLRNLEHGKLIIFWVISIVWATDTAGYFAGKTIGGLKLMPKVSPKKTWAGLFGGMIAAAIVGYAFYTKFGFLHGNITLNGTVILCGLLAAISQMGDLFESWVKRKFDVKDSGQLIPGHGGILDRVDGIIPVAITIAILYVSKVL